MESFLSLSQLSLWTVGAPLIIALVSLFSDATFRRSHGSGIYEQRHIGVAPAARYKTATARGRSFSASRKAHEIDCAKATRPIVLAKRHIWLA